MGQQCLVGAAARPIEVFGTDDRAAELHRGVGPGLETGAFGVYLACEPGKLPQAERAVFRELMLLRDEGLTQKELADAKRYFLGNLKIGMQTNGSQAMQMALDELYSLGYDHMPRYIKEIEAVTQQDVKSAVKNIILPERYVLVTVGPEKD